MAQADVPNPEELDWIKFRASLAEDAGDVVVPMNGLEKGLKKCKDNPFVPLGSFATVCALSYGIYNFVKGRSMMSQYMMRARVLSQGATIVAIFAGLLASAPRKK